MENLRRIQRIGAGTWLDEQEAYWADGRRLDRWLQLHRECKAKYQFCGLVCTECLALIATQNNDEEALKRVAAQ